MIKVRVTHLLAPWPAGADVGSIVALMCDKVPAWALGKCEDAPEGAEPQFAWEPAAQSDPVEGAVAAEASPDIAKAVAEAVAPMLEASNELKKQFDAMAAKFNELAAALAKPEVEAEAGAAGSGTKATKAGR